jgi:hypothetical protein
MTQNTPNAQQAQPIQQQAAPAGLSKGGLSQSQAQDKIKNLLNPVKAAPASEQPKPQPQQKPKEAPPSKDTAQGGDNLPPEDENALQDATGLEGEAEEAEEAPADDGGTEGNEGEEGSEDAPAAEEEHETSEHTVIVDGKEYKVSYEELISGYQRAADYTRKTQALAKERKEVEALKAEVADLPERQKEYQQGAERFTKNAQLVLAALETRFMPQPPSIELAKTDPAAYLHQKEMHQEALQFRGALQHELVKFEHMAKQEHQKAVETGRVKLYEAMPEMKDVASRQKLREYANSLGFTDEQIANEASHTLFVCVEKARRWDELQRSKANLKDKAPLPKVTKRTNAQPSQKAVQQRQKEVALDAHRQRGTIQSAEQAIKARLLGK